MPVAAKRPLLVLGEKAVAERGTLRSGYVHPVVQLPTGVDEKWLHSGDFNDEFSKWLQRVRCHRHVFLGYSSQAGKVAGEVKRFIVEQIGLTVLDWRDDFRPGGIIWDSIEEGGRMADDTLGSSKKRQLAPRDDVAYEAGYFAGAKGRRYSTIIRESGAKTPSDLGGVLYLELSDRADLSPIVAKLPGLPGRGPGGAHIVLRGWRRRVSTPFVA